MIVAIPYIPRLVSADYVLLAKTLVRKGKLLGHSLCVLSTVEDESAAQEWGETIADLFGRTHTVVLTDQTRNGNQLSADLFRAAAKFAYEYQSREGELPDPALLYFSPDCMPVEQGWLDKIQSAYYLNNAPLVFARFAKDDLIQGPLVVRKDFYKASGLLPFVPANIHWRTYLQHEFRKNAVETKLIGPGDSVLRQSKKPAPTA